MKTKNITISVMASCFASCFLLSGCNGQQQIATNLDLFAEVKEEAHLQEDVTAPACQINIRHNYLEATEQTDTLTQRINSTIQSRLFGPAYTSLLPTVAIDSFKNTYISNYRRDVNDFYQEDLRNGTPLNELPSWYNYSYDFKSHFDEGKEGVLNFTAEISEYTGGAHPNTWSRWMNFDRKNGQLLTLKDVFLGGYEKPISQLLLNKLITQMDSRLEHTSIHSLEDLRNEGILSSTDMYVSDEFLLKKEHVAFLYNCYDIAPYSVGQIVLTLSYKEIEKYMKH